MTSSQQPLDQAGEKPRLLVLASTYPRWTGDSEPGFVHELAKRLTDHFEIRALCPHAKGASTHETLDNVQIQRYRYASENWESLVNDGGIVTNLKRNPLKWLLVPSFLLAQTWTTGRLIRRWRPDVIHAHWLIPQGLILALLSLVHRKMSPFLVTSDGANLHALSALVRGMSPIRENIPKICPYSISQRMALCLCSEALCS